MNRPNKITREDGTRWSYGYNDKGEVTSGFREKTASPNDAVPGWNHAYIFDEIGNRKTTTTNLRLSTYTPNNLNQIASRTIPRAFDVIGKAEATNTTVSVAGNLATRLDEYFYKELSAGTGTSAIHVPYTIQANDGTDTTTRIGGKFLPATPEIFTYDLDGNMTSDGRFTLTWDAENRLIGMQTLASVPLPARRKPAFAYDAMGRRIRKTVWYWNGTINTGVWQLHNKFDFIHELNGWNILGERSSDSTSSFLRTYTWGTDLSGNPTGAGGVGGLLFAKLHTSGKTFAYGADMNGNVTLLVDTASGQPAATYDYGPFGEPIRQSGEYATLNPFRFSTKYTDDESGLVDYGMRYYIPSLERWLSRDPIQEKGGINLYGFVGNDGLSRLDRLGLDFIGIGRINYILHGITLHHAIVQYWKTCKTAGSLNSWTTVGELKAKGLTDLNIMASTELTPDEGAGGKGYTSWVTFAAGSNTTIGKRYTELWISYIRNVPNIGLKLAVAFEGTDSEVAAKWEKIMAASSSYEFAEQAKGATSKFPQSIYGSPEYSRPLGGNDFLSPIPFNNSNTFARHVLSQAAIDWAAITTVDFPGNHSPERVIGKWDKLMAN